MDSRGGGDTQDYFSRKRNIEELLSSKDDDSGYIQGKVFMIWPPRSGLHRMNLEVAQDSALYRFEVEVPHRHGISFRPHERVSLALKGMKVDQRKESSVPHHFPIVLRFPDGVIFKYLSGANAGKVVDTWEGNADEWYNPGPVHTVSNAVTIDASPVHRDAVPAETNPYVLTSSRKDSSRVHNADVSADDSFSSLIPAPSGVTIAQSIHQAEQPAAKKRGRPSKPKQRRKRRKLLEEKKSVLSDQPANETDGPCPPDVATSCYEQLPTSMRDSLTSVSHGHTRLLRPTGPTDSEASLREDAVSDRARKRNDTDAIPNAQQAKVPPLKAGFRTERGDVFTALNDLRKGPSMFDIIAVVTYVHPQKKTRTNEWSRSFTLVDPSTIDSLRQTVTVNCFQKKYVEWLPQVQKDDVVILRRLKVVEFNGAVSATGYSDKLRWAVYDPLQRSIRPPDKGTAPERELVDDGMGYEFSPYWEPFPDSTVLEYCQQIGGWWTAMNTLGGQNVSIVQCPGASKQHLLISEASPDHPPRGFFNCTVEVLQKFNNHGGPTVVYVTDYTTSALIYPVQATWCLHELRDRVLQCAMWDDAKNIAKMMNPGEYWYLHNIRAKWNPSHYMEGTMQLAEKVTQLDATKVEDQPHLRALLSRKSELGLNISVLASGLASSHIFPEMLLQDAEGSTGFLTCVVELLHNDLNSRDGHFIYVTDYTYNPNLPTTPLTADWAHNLQHRVLKIKLDGVQARTSLDLRPGSMFIIQNLRIKCSNASDYLHGYLGGENTLIHPLHDPSSHHVQTLERNKEKWKREDIQDVLTTLPNRSHGEALGCLAQLLPVVESTIQQVLAKSAPDMFKVLARVVDFFPFSLEDASALRCTKCKLSPPSSFKRCPRCDDMLETHCKWFYRLYIRLRDEQGSELTVSLSGKECMLLQDVDPADFRDDLAAFRRFLAKIDPILGNLRDVHVAWSRNEHKAVESPLMAFTIESWNIGDKKGYGLLNYVPGPNYDL